MRKVILLFVVLAVLAGGAFGGRKFYRVWKTEREFALAKKAFTEADFKNGSLWLRKALSRNPKHLEGVRLMGDFAELVRSPSALYWRERLVEIQPDSLTNRLILARLAILSSQPAAAKKSLDGVREADRNSPEFHKVMGAFATSSGQFQEAEKHFEAASKLEPTNAVPLLNLAIIQVQRIDPVLSGQARAVLESLRTNPAVRPDALRNLALDAMRRTNLARAVPLAKELAKEPNIPFTDRLFELDVLRAAKSPDFRTTLAILQSEVVTNASATFALGRWMLAAVPPPEMLAWAEGIQPNLKTNLPASMVVADAFLSNNQWKTLEQFASKQQWGELEYLRSAFIARALKEQDLQTASKSEWSKTVKATESRLDRLLALQRLTAVWRWSLEREEILQMIANRFPEQREAVDLLANILAGGGKTRAFMTLMASQSKADPTNLEVKNNLVASALLLNAEEHKPQALALEVFNTKPENPNFASTYAFALYQQKKYKEAKEVLVKLKPEDLAQPNIAGYYGIVLAALGDKPEAVKYLDIAAKVPHLPEETQLFERAKR